MTNLEIPNTDSETVAKIAAALALVAESSDAHPGINVRPSLNELLELFAKVYTAVHSTTDSAGAAASAVAKSSGTGGIHV